MANKSTSKSEVMIMEMEIDLSKGNTTLSYGRKLHKFIRLLLLKFSPSILSDLAPGTLHPRPSDLQTMSIKLINLLDSFKKIYQSGDSGGPLWVTENGKAYLVGVVNRGRGCAKQQSVGIYAR